MEALTANIPDFYKNYRESLSRQAENLKRNLEQQRQNAHASLMSGANTAGVLYSNFPAREKTKYDIGTYMPALTNAQGTYQTGLDSLRKSIVDYENSIADIQDAINHLNSMQ